jgi:hypothetical protein
MYQDDQFAAGAVHTTGGTPSVAIFMQIFKNCDFWGPGKMIQEKT